jgi:hypothetical protein
MAKRTTKKSVTNTSTKSVGGAVATQALDCYDRQPNDVRISQYQGEQPSHNTHLYHTTQTAVENMDAECQDDQIRIGAPSDRPYPYEFETTVDQSKRVPQWQQMKENINARDAVTRTTMQAGVRGTVSGTAELDVPGFHKGPNAYAYTQADNQATNRYSTGQIDVKYSASSPRNYPGHANNAPTSGTVYYG